MLHEIKNQHEVVEIPEPVITLQLVLTIPQTPDPRLVQRKSNIKLKDVENNGVNGSTSMSSMSETSKNSKNKVKFTDDSEESAGDSDYEDSENNESELSDVEEAKEAAPKKNRFAYDEEDSTLDSSATGSTALILLSPSELQVKNGFKSIIQGFENTVGEYIYISNINIRIAINPMYYFRLIINVQLFTFSPSCIDVTGA